MKKNFRHQLTALMTPKEIKEKIKILSNNTHGDYSLEIKVLRQLKNYVCKYLTFVAHILNSIICINDGFFYHG